MKNCFAIIFSAIVLSAFHGPPVNVASEPVYRVIASNDESLPPAVPEPQTPPPRAIIVGPTEGYPGDFIDLDSSKSICRLRKWKIRPERFTDGKQTFKLSADGLICQLSSRPGVVYEVQLIVANEVGIDDTTQKLVIADVLPPTKPQDPPPSPPTVPPVIPTPNPVPVPQNLTEWSREAASRLVTTDPTRAATAKAIARNYRLLAAQSASFANVTEFVKGIDLLAQGVVQQRDVAAAWDPYFREYAAKMQSLGLQTIESHVAAYQLLAAGLEQVP